MALLWPNGMQDHRDHVPDFFVRLTSGDGRLVDVRSPNHVEKSAKQFAMTRKICDEIGWEYEVFTGLPPDRSHNLRWLAGYRHDRNAPSSETTHAICDCFGTLLPLQDGLRHVPRQ
jgi:hypothetical protein